MNMYEDFLCDDIKYIEEIAESIKKMEKVYKSKVYEHKWPGTIRESIKSFHLDVYNTILKMKESLKSAEERRELLHEAYLRQSTENEKDAFGQGQRPGDPAQAITPAKQEDLGASR